jgi:hypothetical protein
MERESVPSDEDAPAALPPGRPPGSSPGSSRDVVFASARGVKSDESSEHLR